MVSYVSAFPKTFFSILMDWHHQMKYGRRLKLYLERLMKLGDINLKMCWSHWVQAMSSPYKSTSPSSKSFFCSWNCVVSKRNMNNWFWPYFRSLALTIQYLYRPSMPPSWPFETGRCLHLQSSWNPWTRSKISWSWWAPSNLPKIKLWLLEIQRWIPKARRSLIQRILLIKKIQSQVSWGVFKI